LVARYRSGAASSNASYIVKATLLHGHTLGDIAWLVAAAGPSGLNLAAPS
jgi:hypothetical protein